MNDTDEEVVREQTVDQALDECFRLLEQEHATIQECLDRYPEYADELEVPLSIVFETQSASLPSPSPNGMAAWRQRTVDALSAREKGRSIGARLGQQVKQIGIRLQGIPQPLPALARLSVPLLLVLAVGAVLYLLIGAPEARAATLTNARGTVEVLPAGHDTWQRISTGHEVEAGDRVRAAESSGAILSLPNGSTIDLKSKTDVNLVKIEVRRYARDSWDIVVHQRRGRTSNCLRCPANETYRFEIRTETATVVARSTEFSVSVGEDGVTDVEVAEGRVAVTALETTRWPEAGQMTSVHPEQVPDLVRPIPARTREEITTPTPGSEEADAGGDKSTDSPSSIETEISEERETFERLNSDERNEEVD